MIDKYGSFIEEYEEEQSVKDLRQYYKDLLTSNIATAQNIYQTAAQSATQQASYDISGAYANFLKQQRNVIAQGQLESGFKEEIGDVLQQQYKSAYQQARATQEKETATAYTNYLKNVETAKTSENKLQMDLTKVLSERALRASEFQDVLWNTLGITNPEEQLTANMYDPEKGLYPAYAKNEKTGRFELTDFGRDMMQRALLQSVDKDEEIVSFESQLTDKQRETYKQYYSEIMNDIAEITPTKDTKGNYLLPDYDESVGKTTRLKTTGYIESQQMPQLTLNENDFAKLDFGESGESKIKNMKTSVFNYAKSIGLDLSEEEIEQQLDDIISRAKNLNTRYSDKQAQHDFDDYIKSLQKQALTKYRGA